MMAKWISVKDELPEPKIAMGGTEFSDDVLTMDEDGVCMVDYVIYPHGLFGADVTPKFNQDERVVTHWALIPAFDGDDE